MMNRTRAATLGLLVPAILALGMSANTSYRFLGQTLQITEPAEQALLCGVAEAAIVALTIYAWATRTKGPAYLAYVAVLVQGIPAFQVGGAAGGPMRVTLGPVLLAVMLHLLLGLELRMSGSQAEGIIGAALRELRERVTAYLGIGRRGADSAAIARSRAADRAVDLADTVAAAQPGTRKHNRRAAHLAAALDAARHGLAAAEADEAEAAIVSRVVRRKSVAGLATIATRHDWTATLPTPRHDTDRDTATTLVATDRDAATPPPVVTEATDHDTTTTPAAATPTVAPVVVDLATKRQTATTRDLAAELDRSRTSVVVDTAATNAAAAPAIATEGAPSVAQIVREAMTAGVTDRDVIVSRVQQYRPGTPRATVARAMQRQESKTRPADTGQYL